MFICEILNMLICAHFEILFDGVFIEFVELDFLSEHVGRNIDGSPKSTPALVIIKNRVETRPVPIEEVFIPQRIVEPVSLLSVSEQCISKPFDGRELGFEPQTADVDRDSIVGRVTHDGRTPHVVVTTASRRTHAAAEGLVLKLIRQRRHVIVALIIARVASQLLQPAGNPASHARSEIQNNSTILKLL